MSKQKGQAFKQKMESFNIIHGFIFITFVCGLIVSTSVAMYLKSDRSKYDLYRPGHNKPQEIEAERTVNVDRTEDLPVYQDDLNDVIAETKKVMDSQQQKQIFKPEDLSDQALVPPQFNLNP